MNTLRAEDICGCDEAECYRALLREVVSTQIALLPRPLVVKICGALYVRGQRDENRVEQAQIERDMLKNFGGLHIENNGKELK